MVFGFVVGVEGDSVVDFGPAVVVVGDLVVDLVVGLAVDLVVGGLVDDVVGLDVVDVVGLKVGGAFLVPKSTH